VRLVDVTSFFSTACGGIKRYYREKSRVLPGRGIDCHFIAPGAAAGEAALGGGTMHFLPGPAVPWSPEYLLFSPGGALGRLLRRLHPDVVEVGSHYFLPGMVRLALEPLGARRPAVVGFFHTDFPRQLVEPVARRLLPPPADDAAVRLAWAFARRQFARYDASLVASRGLAEWLTELGVPRVRWVGLGVDVDVFRPAPADQAPRGDGFASREDELCSSERIAGGSEPVRGFRRKLTVSYVGRFAIEKELGLLLSVWDEVHRLTGARLRFVGEGPSRGTLERFAAARSSVSVEPYLDGPREVASVLRGSDAVVLTSGTETFSLATAEALACGTPVVGPARGAVGELCADSGGGRTFVAGSAASLGAALTAVLSSPAEERLRMGARGRAHILRNFTWDAVAARLADAYASVAPS